MENLSRRVRRLKLLLNVVVLALVSWGIYRTVDHAWSDLADKQLQWQWHPTWLVISGLFYLLGMLPMAAFWYFSLHALGGHVKIMETLRAFFIGGLGKYVPGKALVVVLRTSLLRSERVGATTAAVSVFLETLTMMAVGAFLSLLMLIFWLEDHLRDHPYLLPLGVALLVLSGLPTVPAVFRYLVTRLGMTRLDPNIKARLAGLSLPLILFGWLLASVGWILMALSLSAAVRALGIQGVETWAGLPYFVAAIGMAVVAGFLSLIPGGAGVREYLLSILLGHFYFAAVLNLPFPEATALAVAVVLRLVWLVVELAISAVFFPFSGRQYARDATVN
jgi:uncharacterized membrane protein YbhN (UPF0104 family)